MPRWDRKRYNAKVGQETIYQPTIGKHSLHETTNENGLRLIDFAMSKNIVVSGTYFPHKDIHKMTWWSPDGRTNNQIDDVLIDGRHCSNIMDVRTCRGLNIDSDHYLVRVVFRARISAINNTQPVKRKWAVERLEQTAVKQLYMKAIENRIITDLDDYHRETNINIMWEKLKSCVEVAATEVIGRGVIVKNEWFDDECRNARDEKNTSRLKMLTRATRTTIVLRFVEKNENWNEGFTPKWSYSTETMITGDCIGVSIVTATDIINSRFCAKTWMDRL